MEKPKIICVDFDGTCVTHEYPELGRDIGAARVLHRLVEKGHKLILYTMRSGQKLDAAVGWFHKNNIPLHAINENPDQHTWTDSQKIYANLYIDDASLNAPLVMFPSTGERAYINWNWAEQLLEEAGYL